MFDWLFGKKREILSEENIKKSFLDVKQDMDSVGKWIKHLDNRDKQLFDQLFEVQQDLSSIKDELEGIREAIELSEESVKNKQVFEKLPVLNRQTAVEVVQTAVQTGVQTADFYGILKGLSSNERALVLTLLNNEMKLSYEDLALLLGKEKSTVRGQINSIKQKSEGIIEELVEKNGKKRVFIPEKTREKLSKYVKVRINRGPKARKTEDFDEKIGENDEKT